MENTTKEKYLGIIRHILTGAGAILVATGLLEESTIEIISGGLITLIATIWSWRSKD